MEKRRKMNWRCSLSISPMKIIFWYSSVLNWHLCICCLDTLQWALSLWDMCFKLTVTDWFSFIFLWASSNQAIIFQSNVIQLDVKVTEGQCLRSFIHLSSSALFSNAILILLCFVLFLFLCGVRVFCFLVRWCLVADSVYESGLWISFKTITIWTEILFYKYLFNIFYVIFRTVVFISIIVSWNTTFRPLYPLTFRWCPLFI